MGSKKSFKIGSGEPKFGDKLKVVDNIVLNFTNISGNNNKFYSIELQECDGNYRIFTHYGRVGFEGTKEGRYFLKEDYTQTNGKTIDEIIREESLEEFNKILESKKKKGYVPIDVFQADVGSGKVESKINNQFRKKSTKTSLDSRVQGLVVQIYEEASKTLENTIRTPLGALSESQIDKGYEKLKQIRNAISYDDRKLLVELSSQFYSLIPQKLSYKLGSEIVIDETSKADRQEELLQLMRDVYSVKGSLDSDILAKYKAINAKISPLDKTDEEYLRIEEKIAKTHSSSHNVKLYVDNIFSTDLFSVKGRFNPRKLESMELFHGSANKNILGILQRGLLISPPSAQFNGAAFGRGIYFARHSTKSSQYSTKFHSNIRKNGFLFLADVAVGRMQKVSRYTFGKTLEPGYDSVHAVSGFDLIHDEYIVYNTSQVELKYIVDFTPKSR